MKTCPEGWHLPSNKEWKFLVKFVVAGGVTGIENVAGKKLKAKNGWDKYKNKNGNFIDVGNRGEWWSSDESIHDDKVFRGCGDCAPPWVMANNHEALNELLRTHKSDLLSVRCVQEYIDKQDSIALQEKIDKITKSSIAQQEKVDKITELLKANDLEGYIKECQRTDLRSNFNKKISDLCEKQLFREIKKLPLNKITSPELANIYFAPIEDDNMFPYTTPAKNTNVIFTGKVIQNTGKMAILTHPSDTDFMVKHSGQCILRENQYFQGYGKYIGETTYTTIFGQRTVPTVQLLWCPQ